MTTAILLMLLTGLTWDAVGVLFGAAPSDKDRLYAFFSLNGILFNAFVWLTQTPSVAASNLVLTVYAHDIEDPGAEHDSHNITEADLEMLLSAAKAAGVAVIGFDELTSLQGPIR